MHASPAGRSSSALAALSLVLPGGSSLAAQSPVIALPAGALANLWQAPELPGSRRATRPAPFPSP